MGGEGAIREEINKGKEKTIIQRKKNKEFYKKQATVAVEKEALFTQCLIFYFKRIEAEPF